MRKITVDNYRDDKYYPRVTSAVSEILGRKNFVSPIEVFTAMGLLDSRNVEKWKRGEVQYLERVIQCNLAKASRILRILRLHAHDLNLKPSTTIYKNRGKTLRFSKSGARPIEEAYSRHFVVLGKKKTKPAKHASREPTVINREEDLDEDPF